MQSINLLDRENKTVACVDYGYIYISSICLLEGEEQFVRNVNITLEDSIRSLFKIGFNRFGKLEKLVYWIKKKSLEKLKSKSREENN